MRDERLEDALKYIDELLEVLKNYTSTNDTPEGRTKFELRWFKEEILSGRLTQLPAPREESSTIRHVYAESYLKDIDVPSQKRLRKLIAIFDEGHYLMKPPFYPLVIEEIDKMRALLGDVEPSSMEIAVEIVSSLRKIPYHRISVEQKKLLYPYVQRELNLLRARFSDNTVAPPLTEEEYPAMQLAEQKSIFNRFSNTPEDRQWERLMLLIFEGVRPDPEGKIRNRRW